MIINCNIDNKYTEQFQTLSIDENKFNEYLKKDLFELISKNKQDLKLILDEFFKNSKQEEIANFWKYIENNFVYCLQFLLYPNIEFYLSFLLSLRENNQDIYLINIINKPEYLKKFIDQISCCEVHINEVLFIHAIYKDENVLNFWCENLNKEAKNEIFNNLLWKKYNPSIKKDKIVRYLFKVFSNIIKNKDNNEVYIMLEKFFIFLKKYELYTKYLEMFDSIIPRYSLFFKTFRDISEDEKEKIRYSLVKFATSEDENLRSIFIDLITSSKKSRYFKKYIGLNREIMNKIISKNYYNINQKKILLDYCN